MLALIIGALSALGAGVAWAVYARAGRPAAR
jgi:hypothetical protein